MISRNPLVEHEQLSPAGRDIYASILRTRGNLDGPFLAWLHSPGLAAPAEKLGTFCRYNTSLAKIESALLYCSLRLTSDVVANGRFTRQLLWRQGLIPHRSMRFY